MGIGSAPIAIRYGPRSMLSRSAADLAENGTLDARAMRVHAITTAGLLVLGLLSSAHAGDRVCDGTIGADAIDVDVVIRKGRSCRLQGTRVDGNVKVGSGARLLASGVSVEGNVQAENVGSVAVTANSEIGGNLQAKQGDAVQVQATRVDGDIQLFDNRGKLHVRNNTVGGNLQCKSNRLAPTGGGNRVEGDKEDQCARL